MCGGELVVDDVLVPGVVNCDENLWEDGDVVIWGGFFADSIIQRWSCGLLLNLAEKT